MTRRDAIKLGTTTAMSVAAAPLLAASKASASNEICLMRAVDMVDAIRAKKLSSREVMQAHLKQISRVNGKVNAMVTLVPEDQLMAQAAAADEALAQGQVARPSARSSGCRQRPA